MKPEDLISDEYREILEQYHNETRSWGKNAGKKRKAQVIKLIKEYGTSDILDYGCGKGSLKRTLTKHKVTNYEPGIPEFAALPKPCDIVVSFGALEHVEPDYIDNVLKHIRECTKIVAVLDIGTLRSKHVLPDGREAHLLVRNKDWWIDRLEQAGFEVLEAVPNFDEDSEDHSIKLYSKRGKGCVMFTCKPI
jgi:cyclopropane fatty-acyl-phospholipid synthase-like methyltransferase